MKKTASILSSVVLIALMLVAPSFRTSSSSLVADGAPLPYPQMEGGTLVADGAPLPYPQSGGGHKV